MAAARVALALSLVASVARTGEAERPCAPRAELGGDAEAVAQVAAELRRLGVDASVDPASADPASGLRPPVPGSTRSSCPKIVAAVELDRSGGIAVAVRDGAQRSEGRVVSDAALAAAWIDSWLRDDFAVPYYEPPAPPSATKPIVETPAAAPSPALDRFSLAASYVQMWSDDSTSWSGIAGSLCLRAGDACLGARVSYATQTVTTDLLTAAAKRDFAVLATASYSYPVGRMSIAPELGVGVGWLSTERVEGCKPDPNCDPTNPMTPDCNTMTPPTMCTTEAGVVYVGDGFATSTITPRLSFALRVAIPLFDHVWLDGLAAATASPFGHGEDYAAKDDGTTNTMPGTSFPLPGDPLLGVQLGVGLRVGAR